MTERFLTFDCDGDTLAGVLHEPEREARDVGVLIIVGGPQYRVGSHRQFVLMGRDLCAAGYPVLRFDYRGMGDSSGGARSFESVDHDICKAIDTLFREQPHLRSAVIFGLCDAASAALMYGVRHDVRVLGMILANPWVRTETGQAKAYVRHYYGRRLLQRAFWAKVLTGEFDVANSLRSLRSLVSRAIGVNWDMTVSGSQHFTQRMLAGMQQFRGRVLLLLSGRDLTAREFDDFSRRSPEWARELRSGRVTRRELLDTDHTFSSAKSLRETSGIAVGWLAGIGE